MDSDEMPTAPGAQEAWREAVDNGALLPGPTCGPLERHLNLHVAELHPGEVA